MKVKNPFTPFSHYCLRIPSLSFAFLEVLLEAKDISSSLKAAIKNAFIREAIFLASPALFAQMEEWEKHNIEDVKKRERIKNSLLKYLTRMSTRSTPFGLFAGVAIGEVGNETTVELSTDANQDRITRYDMHFLVSLSKHLEKQDAIRVQLKYYPNSTLYKLGDRYRYVEYSYEDKKRIHSIESVLYSDYLEGILKKANSGTTLTDLINYLFAEGFEKTESEGFINSLIDNQILVSEIEPTITGNGFLEDLKEKLSTLDNCSKELELLHTLSNYLKELSNTISGDFKLYNSINKYISSLKIDFEPKFLLQTDFYPKFSKNQVDRRILRKVKMGLWVLNKISSQQTDPNLEQFKIAFNKRYGHRKMPLLTILDIESGIGYANNQVEATPF